ncbi:MAG: hypothetical protein ACTSQ8_16435 [Candidatus Helarchaeota archaeon]
MEEKVNNRGLLQAIRFQAFIIGLIYVAVLIYGLLKAKLLITLVIFLFFVPPFLKVKETLASAKNSKLT